MWDRLKRDWFAEGMKNRLPILSLLLTYQLLYFPINQYLKGKGGWVADIEWVDSNMPTIAPFVVPYMVSLWMMPLFPIIGALKFPRQLFQEYMVAFFTVMTIGFSTWVLLPAYVEKPPIEGEGIFMHWLKMLHDGDDSYGTHNAIPSSHVYYITLSMCYFIQYDRKLFYPLVAVAVINALSTMFTRQHYFLDVLAGLIVTWVAWRLSKDVITPYIQDLEAKHGLVPTS